MNEFPIDEMVDHVRMRPSKYGFTCYMFTAGRKYIGHGSTMEAAYEAFIQHGSAVLAEEQGLTYFESRAFNMNAKARLSRKNKREKIPDHCLATSKLPWWKRLFRI